MKTENTPTGQIESLVTEQREFFKTGKTLDIAFRREKLKTLGQALKEWKKPLLDALMKDLHKSEEESILTELSMQPPETSEILVKTRQTTNAIENDAFEVLDNLRTTRMLAYHIPLELSGTTAAQSSGRLHLSRMYGNIEAFSLCTACVRCNRQNDQGYF